MRHRGRRQPQKLVVTSNIDHPFYEVIEDGFLLWIKHNIACAEVASVADQRGGGSGYL
jgi:hypothetical protein